MNLRAFLLLIVVVAGVVMPAQPPIAVLSLVVAILAFTTNNEKSPFHYTKLVKLFNQVSQNPIDYLNHKRVTSFMADVGVDVVVYLMRILVILGLVMHWSKLDITQMDRRVASDLFLGGCLRDYPLAHAWLPPLHEACIYRLKFGCLDQHPACR